MSGLGHLEIFFYDGADRNSSQENQKIPETNHGRGDMVDNCYVMPNWPGYGDNSPTHQVVRYSPADSDFEERINTGRLLTRCGEESVEQSHLHQCVDSFPTLSLSQSLRGHNLIDSTCPMPPLSPAFDLEDVKSRYASSHDLAAESTSFCEAPVQNLDSTSSCDSVEYEQSNRDTKISEVTTQEAADHDKAITKQKLSTSLRLFPKHGPNFDASSLIYFRGTSSRLAISTFLLLGRAIGMIMEQPFMTSMGSFASELMTFIADRTQCLSDHYLSTMISDDPEHLHVRRLLQVREAVWGWVHQKSCFLSSLPYHMRQLLQETRDLDKYIEIATASLITHAPRLYKNDVPHKDTSYPDSDTSTNSTSHCEAKKVIPNDLIPVQGAAVSVQHWLQDAAEDGDEEAQYALSRWFTRPAFEESKHCHACSSPFSISLFRHHCRCCGRSHCSLHSSQRRSLLRLGLGLISPVRVCDHCAKGVDQEVLTDVLTWRRMRVEAYFASIGHQSVNKVDTGKTGASSVKCVKNAGTVKEVIDTKARGLILYDDNGIDRNVDKIMRVADYSLQVFKSTVSLNYPTKLVLHTVDILKRYGLSGLAGVLLRKDFMEAVETLKRISGIDHMFSLSLHELTACIYYKIAIDRGLRGCDPQGELVAHTITMASKDLKEEIDIDVAEGSDDRDDSVCEDVREDELDDIIRFAPLALSAVYEEGAADMQRLAFTQGWSTLFISAQSAPEQPAHTLFATDASVKVNEKGQRRKEAVLSVRGTASVEDIVTDIRAAPQNFPPSLEEISKALARQPKTSPYSRTGDMQTDPGSHGDNGVLKDSDGWLMISVDDDIEEEDEQPYACGGMARAALWLLGQVGPALLQLHEEGYEIILVGHSMGGAVAALLCYLLRTHLNATSFTNTTSRSDHIGGRKSPINCRCITYGCPSSMCGKVASDMTGFVTSVVLHDDIVSRITPESIRLLLRELLVFREQVFRHLRQDWTDVILRARDLWSPKTRVRDNLLDLQGQKQLPLPQSPLTDSTTTTSTSNCGHESKSYNSTSKNENEKVEEDKDETDEAAVVVEDAERGEWIPSLWLPGRVLHIYSHLGQYRLAKVPRSLPTLRKIEIQGNIFTDHISQTIFDALLEVRAVRASDRSQASSSGAQNSKGGKSPGPPSWTPYDGSALCACCSFPFTWHSTFKGEAQEYRERYNCRHCGGLICGPCSTKRRAIPRLGLMQPSRVCDRCFYKGDYAHI